MRPSLAHQEALCITIPHMSSVIDEVLPVSSGPAESRRVRRFFYFADGAVAGAVFFFLTYVVSVLLSLAGDVRGAGRWVIVLLLFLLLVLGVRSVWATSMVMDSDSIPPVYKEWNEVRRWPLVVGIAVAIAAGLFGLSVLLWGEEWGAYLPVVNLHVIVTLLLGFGILGLIGNAATEDT